MISRCFLLASLATLGALSLDARRRPLPDLAAPLAVVAQNPQQGWSERSLRGAHGFTYSGSHRTWGAIASSGVIRFDGFGGATADFATSVGGTTFTGTFRANYRVDANGAGSIVIHLPWLNLQGHGNFVLVDRGEGTFFTSTDAGYSVTGSTRRME